MVVVLIVVVMVVCDVFWYFDVLFVFLVLWVDVGVVFDCVIDLWIVCYGDDVECDVIFVDGLLICGVYGCDVCVVLLCVFVCVCFGDEVDVLLLFLYWIEYGVVVWYDLGVLILMMDDDVVMGDSLDIWLILCM